VQEWLTGRSRERPFFLFLNFMDPHLPYKPPHRFEKLVLGESGDTAERDRLRSFEGADARKVIAGRAQLTPLELATLRRLYAAEVASADARLGKVIDTLRSQGLIDETLVVVVGDHGENIGDHGLMEHQFSLHETLLRVPIVLRLPGRVPADVERHDPVQLVDVFATVLEAARVPQEQWPQHEGESLLGPPIDTKRSLVAEYRLPLDQERIFAREMADFDFSPLMQRLLSIQVGSTKLIVAGDEPAELYDLANDPAETENLLEQDPTTARLLLEELQRWKTSRPPRLPVELGRRETETIEALRELGYVE
jgi:arylsulfatase A-like enzyme